MNSLRLRLAVWFGVSFLLLTATFMFLANSLLEEELRQKNAAKTYQEHPSWKIQSSYSEDEVRQIMRELLGVTLTGSLPLVGVAIVLGYWLARKSLRPIASVNQQLQGKTPANLGEPIHLAEADGEFRHLLAHLNDLLKRLDASFKEMDEYAAKVAHEFRTPLTILRLKIEEAGPNIAPDLAEELQSELQQLTYVVDQSLLIARAERGQMKPQRRIFDLSALVTELAEDFGLLAKDENRQVVLNTTCDNAKICADPKHARQIIHNLISNALRHGSGTVKLCVRSRRQAHTLTVANHVTPRTRSVGYSLGLGLRVVNTLLSLEPKLRYQHRRGSNSYIARLTFPDAADLHDAGL